MNEAGHPDTPRSDRERDAAFLRSRWVNAVWRSLMVADIARDLEVAGLDDDRLREELEGRVPHDSAAVKLSLGDHLHAVEQADRARSDVNALLDGGTAARTFRIVSSFVAVLVLLAAAWSLAGVSLGFWNPYTRLHQSVPAGLLIGAALLLLVLAAQPAGRKPQRERALRADLGIDELAAAEYASLEKLDEVLDEQAAEAVIARINEARRPSYATRFTVGTTRGLEETAEPIYEVLTPGSDRLRASIAARAAGSIGLAGPRGVGKSTLLRSFCLGRSVLEEEERPRLGVVAAAPVEYEARDFLLHLFASVCRAVLLREGGDPIRAGIVREGEYEARRSAQVVAFAGLMAALVGLALAVGTVLDVQVSARTLQLVGGGALVYAGAAVVLLGRRRLQRGRWDRIGDAAESGIERNAENHLRTIHYQQTRTTGWSGRFKSPVGFEFGGTRRSSIAEIPLPLPELVEMFKRFLGLLGEKRRVFIGIDELDKIESAVAATGFVNDLKSVFGVRGCFFIVSVSEDAMASFERRGLPFRDAFDSAFDEVVMLDYLGHSEVRELAERRLVGIPIPFQMLCFALSGGLPRDLLRVAREFVRYGERRGPLELAAIARDLALDEWEGKVRAATHVVRRASAASAAQLFAGWLVDISDVRSGSPEGLVDSAGEATARAFDELVRSGLMHDLSASDDGQRLAAGRDLARLAAELLAFSLYAVALTELFARWREAEDPEPFCAAAALLAAARQGFSISPDVAAARVRQVRRSLGLTDGPSVRVERD